MSFIPAPQEIYKHFKGNLYQIVTIAEHSETGEQLVIYQALYGEYKTYARPLAMFTSRVDREKYPEVTQEYRFELQGPGAARQRAESEEATEAPASEYLDPQVAEFLDADSYEEKLNILTGLHHRMNAEMLTTMAISCDIEFRSSELEEQYEELRGCLLTLERYECKRLR